MDNNGALKTWLSLAILLVILSLVTLPFQDLNSASFVVNIFALIVAFILLVLIIVFIKKRIIV